MARVDDEGTIGMPTDRPTAAELNDFNRLHALVRDLRALDRGTDGLIYNLMLAWAQHHGQPTEPPPSQRTCDILNILDRALHDRAFRAQIEEHWQQHGVSATTGLDWVQVFLDGVRQSLEEQRAGGL